MSGPIHAIDERFDKGSSHKARSTALELLVASQFAQAGYSISFDTEADVEVIDKTVLFHVECKRPSKYENIEKCVGDAYSQLKKRYASYNGDLKQRGFAFISITKLVNPDNGTLLLKNKLEIKERLDALASNYLTENKHLFYKNLDDRTMGVIFYLQMAIKTPEYNGLFIYRHLAGIYVSNTNDPNIENQNRDRVYFREIMTKLNQGFVSIFSDK